MESIQNKWPWFERHFNFDFPAEKMPDILERLRGTPPRVDAAVGQVDAELARRAEGDTWSIQENVGHLADIEPLWSGRIDDILSSNPTMREADLTNQATFDANHNQAELSELCGRLHRVRRELVAKLDGLNPQQWSASALHPRLNEPMRIVDLCFFVAEHDDYHLARIRHLIQRFGSSEG